MANHERPGLLGRGFRALARALKRGILGKSSHDYMKQFTGGDEHWNNLSAAPLKIEQANGRAGEGTRIADAPEYEPVHAWTKRQLEDYLARNPGYRSTYEAELQKALPASKERK